MSAKGDKDMPITGYDLFLLTIGNMNLSMIFEYLGEKELSSYLDENPEAAQELYANFLNIIKDVSFTDKEFLIVSKIINPYTELIFIKQIINCMPELESVYSSKLAKINSKIQKQSSIKNDTLDHIDRLLIKNMNVTIGGMPRKTNSTPTVEKRAAITGLWSFLVVSTIVLTRWTLDVASVKQDLALETRLLGPALQTAVNTVTPLAGNVRPQGAIKRFWEGGIWGNYTEYRLNKVEQATIIYGRELVQNWTEQAERYYDHHPTVVVGDVLSPICSNWSGICGYLNFTRGWEVGNPFTVRFARELLPTVVTYSPTRTPPKFERKMGKQLREEIKEIATQLTKVEHANQAAHWETVSGILGFMGNLASVFGFLNVAFILTIGQSITNLAKGTTARIVSRLPESEETRRQKLVNATERIQQMYAANEVRAYCQLSNAALKSNITSRFSNQGVKAEDERIQRIQRAIRARCPRRVNDIEAQRERVKAYLSVTLAPEEKCPPSNEAITAAYSYYEYGVPTAGEIEYIKRELMREPECRSGNAQATTATDQRPRRGAPSGLSVLRHGTSVINETEGGKRKTRKLRHHRKSKTHRRR